MSLPSVFVVSFLVAASGGNELVLVLDNSGSMISESRDSEGNRYPANDPERAAVLGTLVVEGLARGSADRLTVIAFGEQAGAPPRVVTTADEIRSLPYSGGTWFRQPLVTARDKLQASTLERRLFLFFTDGAPEDLSDPAEGRRLLGIDSGKDFDTLLVGLFGSEETRSHGAQFLRPLARDERDLLFVRQPREIIGAFTRGYARVLGSRPEAGTLSPGGSKSFDVGKYVVEVLVATASAERGPAYEATLTGPGGVVPAQASGDNGCPPGMRYSNAPDLCTPPFRQYRVFRAPNDPARPSRWTLALPSAPGAVDYGIILRYDLQATLAVPPVTRVGEPVTLDARLLFRGNTFDDESFFSQDGFTAVALVEGKELPLRHEGGGRFVAEWTPSVPSEEGSPTPVQVVFRNQWMEQSARRAVQVTGFLDLVLVARPSPLELGSWRGERGETRRCAVIDLSGSTNADRVPVTCQAAGDRREGTLACTPVPGSEANLGDGRPGQPLRYEVCLIMPGCCDLEDGTGLGVRLAGTHPHYAPGAVLVPVQARVEPTGWLRCYWPYLAIAAAILFALWVILGFVRPHSFDMALTVCVAGSEAGLRRASALVLRELPGGTRGFYRNARMCLNATGDFVRSPKEAAIVLEAGPGNSTRFTKAAGLERKVPRTGKWEPVPPAELEAGHTPNVIYRAGNLHLRWS